MKPDLFQAQLFLDDGGVSESVRLGRVWHPAHKRHEPVLAGGTPWEGSLICAFGSVLRHDGRFRIWYVTFDHPEHHVCYAESADGIRWTKPSLGLVEHGGSKDNNILFDLPRPDLVDCLGVIDDPEDRAWPLKMIYCHWQSATSKPALCAARSTDGIRWDHTPGKVLPDWGDRTNVMPAKDNGKYVVFSRFHEHHQRFMGRDRTHLRVVSRTESEDLIHWSEPELVGMPDLDDNPYLQFYSATAFRYESQYVGFIERMHMVPDVLDPEIWFSRDGHRWQRSRPRNAFIPLGPDYTWDCGWVNATSNAPISFNGELLIHYSGRAHGHTYPPSRRMGAIGVAGLRIDGFCSLAATEKEGWLVTHPMRWPKAELLVNLDPRRDDRSHPHFRGGELAVEVRTPSGKPVNGFAFDDCAPMRHNTVQSRNGLAAEMIRWKDDRKLAALGGREIRLVFRLRDAHLYSFRAGKE